MFNSNPQFTIRNSQSGAFTLIELLVVVAIIAVLVAILLPALSAARDAAKKAVCASHFHSIGLGLTEYGNDYNDYAPYAVDAWGTLRTYYWPGVHGSPGYMGLGVLWHEGYITDGNVFQCPMLPGFYDNIDTFQGYLTKFPADGKCVLRIVYLPAVRRRQLHPEPTSRQRHKLLPTTAFITENMAWWYDNVGAHGTGNNVLYGDGSVVFRRGGNATNGLPWLEDHSHELDRTNEW